MENIPYTYLIGWSATKKYYYGVRYAKSAHPSDLWVKYFTSSNIVKRYAADHGDPDIIEVRKTFTDGKKAKLWEDRVLRRMKVQLKEEWMNIRGDSFNGCACSVPWQKILGLDSTAVIEYKKKMAANMSRNRRNGTIPTAGYTNEYRKEMGMKLLTGKPKGCKEKLETRMKKSATQKNYINIRNIMSGKCERVKRDLGLALIESGEYQSAMKGQKRSNPYSDKIIQKYRQIAQNRPMWYCEECDRHIKGRMNWDRHLISEKHRKQKEYNDTF